MKRTSSRLQKQAHVSYAHSSESESKEPMPQGPSKKKRKTAHRRPRTVANARQRRIERYREGLLQVPMELWFEILSYLEPNDMLALSRTSKDFRAVLMDKSSIKLWKTAFLNAPDVPKPLPGFSEPQHASLLFDNHCQNCLASNADFQMMTKYCNRCTPLFFKTRKELMRNHEISRLPVIMLESYYLPARPTSRSCQTFHLPDVMKLAQEYAVVLGTGDFDSWKKSCKEAMEARRENASCVQKWLNEVEARKRREARQTTEKRRETIIERLKSSGWEDELKYLGLSFHEHKLVDQAKELSERAWNTTVRPQLVKYLEDHKKARLTLDRVETVRNILPGIYNRYMKGQPFNAIVPPPSELAVIPQFKDVITNTPLETTLTQASFDSVVEKLPEICSEWRTTKERQLVDMFKESGLASKKSLLTVDSLKLAKVLFRCRACGESISYPRVLVHDCHKMAFESDSISPVDRIKTEDLWNRTEPTVVFDAKASKATVLIMQTCGLNPNTTTAEELEASDTTVMCSLCTDYGKEYMRWRDLLYHIHEKKHRINDLTFTPLSNEEKTLINNAYASIPALEDLYRNRMVYRCKYCNMKATRYNIRDHLADEHSISDNEAANIREHWGWAPDRPIMSLAVVTPIDRPRRHQTQLSFSIRCQKSFVGLSSLASGSWIF